MIIDGGHGYTGWANRVIIVLELEASSSESEYWEISM